jgi:aminopeptidase N
MKKIIALLLFLIFRAATALCQEPVSRDPQFNGNRVRTYDVQSYVIRTSFDRVAKTVFGDTTIEFKPLKDNFSRLVLDAAGFKYESVKLEPAGTALNYAQSGEKLTVNLDHAYNASDTISVRIKYSSSQPKKGVYFVSAGSGRPAQTWTQGESEEAHFWFPSYDFPDDKATTEQFIVAPKGEVAVANGDLVETIANADGTTTYHYKMPIPHSVYLTSFVVGNYARVEDKYNDIPLSYYMYPGSEASAHKFFGRTPEMIKVYEDLTGVPFPYKKYDQTLVANFQFGGMENITATTMADTEILLSDSNTVVDLVSHELSHSWFGDMVTCRSWSHLWLNEGFATFMEAALREKLFGRADYLRKINEDATRYMAEDAKGAGRHALLWPNPPTDETLFDVTTYQKGGSVVHMLREQVGSDIFWKAINTYLNDHKFGNVETSDLEKAMEAASGQNLDWFFRQWVYQAGFPRLAIRQTYSPRSGKLTLIVTQMQKPDGITPEAFVLPLDLQIETAGGSSSEKILVNKRVQSFVISIPARPTKIVVDKDEKIPLKSVKLSGVATEKSTAR